MAQIRSLDSKTPVYPLAITWHPDKLGHTEGFIGSIRVWRIETEGGRVFLCGMAAGALREHGASNNRVWCESYDDAKETAQMHIATMRVATPDYDTATDNHNDAMLALVRVKDALEKTGVACDLPSAREIMRSPAFYVADRLATAIRQLCPIRPVNRVVETAPTTPGLFVRIWLSAALAVAALSVLTHYFH